MILRKGLIIEDKDSFKKYLVSFIVFNYYSGLVLNNELDLLIEVCI